MQKRRAYGKRRPPDRAPVLRASYEAAVEALGGGGQVAIGGKSMGGRIASMLADGTGVRGLVCLGYPFHAPGKPMNPDRMAHLEILKTPALFCQGTRDTLGSAEDVGTYTLSGTITMHWLDDGDHGFRPRKASGFTEAEHWQGALKAIVKFLRRV